MAERYGYRDEPYRGERGWRNERGFTERAGDEVRSWFGDEEAERRRRMDERERERREPSYGARPANYDYGWASERDRGTFRGQTERGWRGETPERWSTDYGRTEFERTGAASRGWNEPDYGYKPARGYGYYGGPDVERGRTSGGARYGVGSFSGRGPKGYQRSDERIREDVCDRLADDPMIDASDIEVIVKNAEVTLSGTVRERDDKRRSEDSAENVSGVREVHNNLRVNRGQETTGVGTSVTGTTATGSARR